MEKAFQQSLLESADDDLKEVDRYGIAVQLDKSDAKLAKLEERYSAFVRNWRKQCGQWELLAEDKVEEEDQTWVKECRAKLGHFLPDWFGDMNMPELVGLNRRKEWEFPKDYEELQSNVFGFAEYEPIA